MANDACSPPALITRKYSSSCSSSMIITSEADTIDFEFCSIDVNGSRREEGGLPTSPKLSWAARPSSSVLFLTDRSRSVTAPRPYIVIHESHKSGDNRRRAGADPRSKFCSSLDVPNCRRQQPIRSVLQSSSLPIPAVAEYKPAGAAGPTSFERSSKSCKNRRYLEHDPVLARSCSLNRIARVRVRSGCAESRIPNPEPNLHASDVTLMRKPQTTRIFSESAGDRDSYSSSEQLISQQKSRSSTVDGRSQQINGRLEKSRSMKTASNSVRLADCALHTNQDSRFYRAAGIWHPREHVPLAGRAGRCKLKPQAMSSHRQLIGDRNREYRPKASTPIVNDAAISTKTGSRFLALHYLQKRLDSHELTHRTFLPYHISLLGCC